MIAKKIILLFSLAALGLGSCAPPAPQKVDPRPDGVLSEAEMVEILTDAHIIEGARIGSQMMGDSLSIDVYYDKLWDKYQISRSIYDSSFSYYARNPQVMEQLYQRVLANLSSEASAYRDEP